MSVNSPSHPVGALGKTSHPNTEKTQKTVDCYLLLAIEVFKFMKAFATRILSLRVSVIAAPIFHNKNTPYQIFKF